LKEFYILLYNSLYSNFHIIEKSELKSFKIQQKTWKKLYPRYLSLPELGLAILFIYIVVTPFYPIAMLVNGMDASYEILNSAFNLDGRKYLRPITQYAIGFIHTFACIGGTIWTLHALLIGILSIFFMTYWLQVGTGSSGVQREKGNNNNYSKQGQGECDKFN